MSCILRNKWSLPWPNPVPTRISPATDHSSRLPSHGRSFAESCLPTIRRRTRCCDASAARRGPNRASPPPVSPPASVHPNAGPDASPARDPTAGPNAACTASASDRQPRRAAVPISAWPHARLGPPRP
ncbi:hypothetical protein NL676_038835 [Syzygium grande]|nr:hypothetical protein NL676_038835 [Syzygium grande]